MIEKREQDEIEKMKEFVDKKRVGGRKEQKFTNKTKEAQVKRRTELTCASRPFKERN